MALLFAIFVVPIGGLAGLLVGQQNARIDLTVRERSGLAFTTRTVAVVASVLLLRDRFATSRESRDAERAAVERDLEALEYGTSGPGRSLELTRRLARLAAQWRAVPRIASPLAERRLTDVLDTALSLFALTNDRAALTSDADGATADLIDAYETQFPTIAEDVDEAKRTLVQTRGTHGAATGARIDSALLVGEAMHAADIAQNAFIRARRRDGATERERLAMLALQKRLVAFLGATTARAGPARDAQVRRTADAALATVFVSEDVFARAVAARLDRRLAEERAWLLDLEVFAVGAIVVGIWVAFWVGRTLRARDRRELRRERAHAKRLTAELERNRIVEALAMTEAQFRAVFDRSSIGVAILDREGSVLRSNGALQQTFATVDARRIGAGHPDFARLFSGDLESYVLELEAPTTHGGHGWFEATLSLVRDDEGEPRFAISMLKDVTERKRIDDRLRYDASHDTLTGLSNRALFLERLQAACSSPSGDGERAVLFIDLDEFKFVNDSLGHAVGDRVLVAVGARLHRFTAPSDCVARLGGDEFAVLLGARASRAQIDDLVHALGRALAEPISLGGQDVFVTASVGVAFVHDGYAAADDLLRDADTAMYHAKSAGRARAATFDTAMHVEVSRRLDVATQLRRALEREQLTIVYQPIVSLATGQLTSCEALVRWSHPDLGDVSPAEFVTIAEEIGLVVPIGRFVLDAACAQFARWKAVSPLARPRRISVNASVREVVQVDYADFVASTVARYGLEPGELLVEVTETSVLSSGAFSGGALERIKASGAGLAIDDFGTGYSSLRYLQQFPFDELKIDRAFVGGFDGYLASEPIVTMVLTLARACGVHVVAEGVETAAQAARLRGLGCGFAQGFFFGQPLDAEAILTRCVAGDVAFTR